jgi:hypothetical protein
MNCLPRLAVLAAVVSAAVAPSAYPGPRGLLAPKNPSCRPCPCVPCPGFGAPAGTTSPAGAEPESEAKPPAQARVHILLVGDTVDPNIGASDEADLDSMTDLFTRGIPAAQRGTFRVLEGRVSADEVLAAVDALSVRPSDTVFFYFTGHGSYDPRFAGGDPSGGYYFAFPSGPTLLRRVVLARLRRKNARLTVVLTDTCAEEGGTSSRPGRAPRIPKADDKAADNGVLYTLLLRQTGLVNINGAAIGQLGWTDPENPGSLFTKAFVRMCQEARFPNPANVTWRQALNYLSRTTNALYQDLRRRRLANPQLSPSSRALYQRQSAQRPQAFQLTTWP